MRHVRQAPRPGRLVLPSNAPVRVAIDFLGGDAAPACVADAVALYLQEPGPAALTIVGPVDRARGMLSERGVDVVRLESHGVLDFAPAQAAADMADEAIGVLRTVPDLTASVAAGLVADGQVDAWVTAGHSGAAVAASALAIGRLQGMPLPALAVVLPALAGPVVLADAGATSDVGPEHLLSFAITATAYAHCLGLAAPTVGLLTIGSESGKGDRLRKSAHDLLTVALADAGISYAGPVEGHDVATGARANVIVTDGFTGNVLLKGIEGTVAWAAARMGEAYGEVGPAAAVAQGVATSDFAGGLVLGVDGICIVGHGAGTAAEIAACLRLAARMAATDVVAASRSALVPMASRLQGAGA